MVPCSPWNWSYSHLRWSAWLGGLGLGLPCLETAQWGYPGFPQPKQACWLLGSSGVIYHGNQNLTMTWLSTFWAFSYSVDKLHQLVQEELVRACFFVTTLMVLRFSIVAQNYLKALGRRCTRNMNFMLTHGSCAIPKPEICKTNSGDALISFSLSPSSSVKVVREEGWSGLGKWKGKGKWL